MSEPIKLEELVQQLIGLQKKLENAEQKLAGIQQRAESGTAEAALFAIARQMAIANEDRREEKAAKEREKEREIQRLNAYDARDRMDGTKGFRWSHGVGAGICWIGE